MKWYDSLWNFWYSNVTEGGERIVSITNLWIFLIWVGIWVGIAAFNEPDKPRQCDEEETTFTIMFMGFGGGAIIASSFPIICFIAVPIGAYFLIFNLAKKWGSNCRRLSQPTDPEAVKKKIKELQKIINDAEK